MRIAILKQNRSGGLNAGGGTLSGPLILPADPVQPMEAVTKQYVDTSVNNLNASHLTSGTLPIGRLPAFTGDLTNAPGSNVFTLGNTTVTPGQYTKVTVDIKGRIVNGYNLIESDIPNLDWSKIGSGKPTTLSGYGITDALTSAGGTFTGNLNITVAPTDNLHIGNKAYVDSLVAGSSGVPTGTIVRKPTSVTPNSFLRCNGADISKTTYAALYAVLGDSFSFSVTPGAGRPWQQQYDLNLDQVADITGWATGQVLSGNLTLAQVVVTKNRVYLLGGSTAAGTNTSAISYANINTDGSLSAWTGTSPLPGVLANSSVFVTKNRVYLVGGTNGTTVQSVVYTAGINTDGSLGGWSIDTALPGAIKDTQTIVTKNRVYLLGGFNSAGSAVSTVYTAPIDANGIVGAWTTGTALPANIAQSQAVVTKNRVYLLGGNTAGGTSAVYTAPINSDGTLGTWSTGTSIPAPVFSAQAFVARNRVYLIGGSAVSAVYNAPINADGTLGTWSTGTSLPANISSSQVIATKSHIYILAGLINSAYSTATYTAPILDGINDYTSYYDGTWSATDPNNFRLPDYSNRELFGTYSYIKT